AVCRRSLCPASCVLHHVRHRYPGSIRAGVSQSKQAAKLVLISSIMYSLHVIRTASIQALSQQIWLGALKSKMDHRIHENLLLHWRYTPSLVQFPKLAEWILKAKCLGQSEP